MRRTSFAAPIALLFAISCRGRYAALATESPEATRVTSLHWWMFWISAAVSLVIVGALAVALGRRAEPPSTAGERRRSRAVAGGTIVSALLLLVLLIMSVVAGRANVTPVGPEALEIEIMGHQWWWEIRYPSPVRGQTVVTANEIHVPVGRPVRLLLSTNDVIHSFWAPQLNGKKDLIPGRPLTHLFRTERPGVFQGRCAEFCGYQHAHMGFLVVAEPPERFSEWLAGQRHEAAEPIDPATERGRRVFLSSACVLCHTIRGVFAFGHTGPDLTHLASRRMIAAATLPNTSGHLAGWIVDAQAAKPGSRMPPNLLPADDLLDLVAYLGTLK